MTPNRRFRWWIWWTISPCQLLSKLCLRTSINLRNNELVKTSKLLHQKRSWIFWMEGAICGFTNLSVWFWCSCYQRCILNNTTSPFSTSWDWRSRSGSDLFPKLRSRVSISQFFLKAERYFPHPPLAFCIHQSSRRQLQRWPGLVNINIVTHATWGC